jgi:ESCRT-I complex subunit TSG101
MTALEQYRAITYRVDAYVFNDGSRKELLNLSGTIPVVYKSEKF